MSRPQSFPRIRPSVAKRARRGYVAEVVTVLATDLGRSKTTRRTSAHTPIAGAFFVPAMPCYGGCAWDAFGRAGFRVSRSANPRTAVTIPCLAACGDGSDNTYGASPMTHDPARNPSALSERAAAHRGMAVAALRADSSLAVRLARYNRHMTTARALEAEARQQQTTRTSDPRAALAWIQSGRSVRIEALNLRHHQQHAEALAAVEALEVRRA